MRNKFMKRFIVSTSILLLFLSISVAPTIAADALDKTMENIVNHLEFVGYSVEKRTKDEFKAKHQSKYSFYVRKYNGGLLFRVVFTKLKKPAEERRAAYIGLINTFNSAAIVCRFYADKNNYFVVEAWINYW